MMLLLQIALVLCSSTCLLGSRTIAPVPPMDCVDFFRILASTAIIHQKETDESQLLIDLFREYQPFARPVVNRTQGPIRVGMKLQLVLLVNIDEVGQYMQTNVWLTLNWTDEYLRWNPALYGGVKTLRVPPDKVWLPDIVLMNNADGQYEVSFKSNVLINSSGTVMWVPPAIYKSSCKMDIHYFPFDQQICNMSFTSWTYNTTEVKLEFNRATGVDLSQFLNSFIWDIVDAPGYVNSTTGTITYRLYLRRKTLFYTVILILPCVLMATLTAMVFYLPAAAGEKIGMSILLLLSVVVFLNVLMKILPSSSLTVPLIARYLLFIFVMNLTSILLSVAVVNYFFRGPHTHHLPVWLKFLFIKLFAKLLLMQRPRRVPVVVSFDGSGEHGLDSRKLSTYAALKEELQKMKLRALNNAITQFEQEEGRNEPELLEIAARAKSNSIYLNDSVDHHPHCPKFGTPLPPGGIPRIELPSDCEPRLSMHLSEPPPDEAYRVQGLPDTGVIVLKTVEFISEHLKHQQDAQKIRDDWKYISMVTDRILLYIFVGIITGLTLGVFFSAPNIFEKVDQGKEVYRLGLRYNWDPNIKNFMKQTLYAHEQW